MFSIFTRWYIYSEVQDRNEMFHTFREELLTNKYIIKI